VGAHGVDTTPAELVASRRLDRTRSILPDNG
jgi:hypothetical protein